MIDAAEARCRLSRQHHGKSGMRLGRHEARIEPERPVERFERKLALAALQINIAEPIMSALDARIDLQRLLDQSFRPRQRRLPFAQQIGARLDEPRGQSDQRQRRMRLAPQDFLIQRRRRGIVVRRQAAILDGQGLGDQPMQRSKRKLGIVQSARRRIGGLDLEVAGDAPRNDAIGVARIAVSGIIGGPHHGPIRQVSQTGMNENVQALPADGSPPPISAACRTVRRLQRAPVDHRQTRKTATRWRARFSVMAAASAAASACCA